MILGGRYLAKALEERSRREKSLVERYRRTYGVEPAPDQLAAALGYSLPLVVAVAVVALELYLVVVLVSDALSLPPGTERNVQVVVAILVPELVAALRAVRWPAQRQVPSVASLLAKP